MSKIKQLLENTPGLLLTGTILGAIFVLLTYWGNPSNMGFCSICFVRDTAGALGLHHFIPAQYIRPEFIGIILGSTLAALLFGELKAGVSRAPVVHFLLGMIAFTGTLMFLGCPWRAFGRLGGGDLTSIAGILGLIAGIWVASQCLKKGFALGEELPTWRISAFFMPAIAIGLLCILLFLTPNTAPNQIPMASLKGPGSQHAPILLSLGAGILIGFLIQRSRFCTIGVFRDLFLFKQTGRFYALLLFLGVAVVFNLIFGFFNIGFENQPLAHNDYLLSFVAMGIAGIACTLAGGCPGRQMVMAGQGNGGSTFFILGMIPAAALLHNFNVAATPKGPVSGSWWALLICAGILLAIILFVRGKCDTE